MAPVDVEVEIEIARPRTEVAAYAADPDNAEIVAFEPGERLLMRTADGPFPMETTYTWADTAGRGTRMTLRNRGEPGGFSKLAGLVMVPAIRRANRKDLERLKGVLSGPAA